MQEYSIISRGRIENTVPPIPGGGLEGPGGAPFCAPAASYGALGAPALAACCTCACAMYACCCPEAWSYFVSSACDLAGPCRVPACLCVCLPLLRLGCLASVGAAMLLHFLAAEHPCYCMPPAGDSNVVDSASCQAGAGRHVQVHCIHPCDWLSARSHTVL